MSVAVPKVGDYMPEVIEEARAAGEVIGRAKAAAGHPNARGRKKMGRPTRLHQDLIEDICDTIRQGNYQETAALAHGVPSSTYHNWKARGQEARAIIEATGRLPEDKAGERIFLEFLEATEAARAEAESLAVQALTRAAFGGEVVQVEDVIATDDEGEEEVVGRVVKYAKPSVEALKFYLERSFPQKYGRRIEVSGPESGPIPVEVEVSARDLIRKRLDQVASRIGDDGQEPEESANIPG